MPIHVRTDDAVAQVTLDSPGKHNALTVQMWRELRAAMEALAADAALHCIVLRGAGGHFAAGADIAEFPQQRFDRASGRRYHLELIAPALEAIRNAPPPVIAAIEGSCVGGGLEIASVCDLRVAAADARLGAPVGRLGFPLALPELSPLLQLVGPALAADLLLTGRLLGAEEARALGLVQRVAPAGGLDALLDEVVAAVRAGSPLAARLNKQNLRMLQAQGGRYTAAQLDDSFAFFESADYTEGMRAFLARRPPDFRGR
jgi:enoyl-CoA hydratase/carnithine racemase